MGFLVTLQARSSYPLQASGLRLQKVPIDTQDSIAYRRKFLVQNLDLLFVILYDIALSVALVPYLFVAAFPQFWFPSFQDSSTTHLSSGEPRPRPRMVFH